jgi:hypothetical protein
MKMSRHRQYEVNRRMTGHISGGEQQVRRYGVLHAEIPFKEVEMAKCVLWGL